MYLKKKCCHSLKKLDQELCRSKGSTFAHLFVYLTLLVETLAFVFAYTRTSDRLVRFPGLSSYSNFGFVSFLCLGAGILLYVPVLVEFSEFLLDPRQIYTQT